LNYEIDLDRLQDTFKEGISASMPHICAGLDIKREEKLLKVEKSFQESNIVIIHGASGQGKTALALRYFYDRLPLSFSYQIKEATDREQAYVISEAIIMHHKAFNMPMYLYYDISPGDDNWMSIIERIGNEAELIFAKFQQNEFTDFEESWLKFDEKNALLEYIYFLNFGERLEDRLKNQINKQVNNRQLEKEFLEVLRIIILITGFEARVIVNKIEAFHPIRSRIISNYLFDEVFIPWENVVIKAFPAILLE